MKVSIGSKIVRGPWGGGNLFAINLSQYLIEKGHQVLYDLTEPDIDLILLTDPRSRGESSSTFNHLQIMEYKSYVNPNVIVVQRINECDERKNTNNINKFYLNASKVADHVIFVSTWLQNIYINEGMKKEKTSVILAGANKKIFNNTDLSVWNKKDPLKIVTHHWSSHENKGFKTYQMLDSMIGKPDWKNKIEFTYIGNFNSDYKFYNTNLIEPLDGINLATEIKKHHVYITGSINEPSGNHHIEAAQCGLPILYKNSGGIPEYCAEYGLSFGENINDAINEMFKKYDKFRIKMADYPLSSEKMCSEFVDLFNKLFEDKRKNDFEISIIGKFILIKNKLTNLYRNVVLTILKEKVIRLVKKNKND